MTNRAAFPEMSEHLTVPISAGAPASLKGEIQARQGASSILHTLIWRLDNRQRRQWSFG
jgi:hypothetical protein